MVINISNIGNLGKGKKQTKTTYAGGYLYNLNNLNDLKFIRYGRKMKNIKNVKIIGHIKNYLECIIMTLLACVFLPLATFLQPFHNSEVLTLVGVLGLFSIIMPFVIYFLWTWHKG